MVACLRLFVLLPPIENGSKSILISNGENTILRIMMVLTSSIYNSSKADISCKSMTIKSG